MRSPQTLLFAGVLSILATVWPTQSAFAWQSDPNAPDTVSIPSIPWRGDTVVALDISVTTDDSLSTAQLVFAWPNPALRVDSVKFSVGRWNVPGYHRWSRPGDGTVVVAFMPTQKRLPPGSGPVARLWAGRDSAYVFDTDFDIEPALIDAPPPRAPFQTVFADLPGQAYAPAMVSGATITFSPCICPDHGNVSGTGGIDAVDLTMVIDGIFFGGSMPMKDSECPHIHRGDFNCDNVFNAVDLTVFIGHIFFGGAPPCDPCEDL